MATQLKSLAQLFNERAFRIPDYQRGFSWGKRQLDDFWQDIDRLPNGRNHYTGQITLEPVTRERWLTWEEDTWLFSDANCQPYYVVDGQQRLTTAIILIKCLLDTFPDDNQEISRTPKFQHVVKYLVRKSGPSRAYIFGYERDNPSYEFFKTRILDERSVQDQAMETLYTRNLLFARDYFSGKLRNMNAEGREELFRRLTQRFVFNEYEIGDDLDVFVAFETMNNRGKPLSRLELLKNRLIYLSTLLNAPAGQQSTLRRNINDAWKTIYEFLGKDPDRVLDDDDFLKAHWIMYFTYARDQAGVYQTFLLEEHFTPAKTISGELTADDLQKYVSSIQDAARAWYAVNFPAQANQLSDTVRKAVDRLNRARIGAFGPLAMTLIVKKYPDEEIRNVLREAERFIFLVSLLCNRKADTGDSEFYRLTGALFKGESTIADVERAIRERTKKHFEVNRLRTEFDDLFSGDDQNGFYSWNGLRHFLFEYELYLKETAQAATTKINWDDFTRSRKDHVTIDHIYPQTPRQGDWPEFSRHTRDQRKRLCHSLGNLVALSQHKNAALSNKPFEEKKLAEDGAPGYSTGSYSEIEVAAYRSWTPKDIRQRGLKLLGFLEEHWDVSLGSEQDKVTLLKLEFLDKD